METDLTSSGQPSTALQNTGRSTHGEVSYEWGDVGVVISESKTESEN
jgi:hypothetical protein